MNDNLIAAQDIETCRTQGRLYVYVERHHYDIIDFSDKYLASDFCNREMDSIYSVFQREDPVQILDFVMPEISPVKTAIDREHLAYPEDIGFLYRYLHYLTGMSSRDLVTKIDTKSMIQEMDQRLDWNIEDIAEIVAETKLGYNPSRPYEY